MTRAWLLVFVLTACPHPGPRPTPAPDAAPGTIPACTTAVITTNYDVCDGTFTSDGKACVQCGTAQGCIDVPTATYCVKGGCLDPACTFTGVGAKH